jgi:hypothetical protein
LILSLKTLLDIHQMSFVGKNGLMKKSIFNVIWF